MDPFKPYQARAIAVAAPKLSRPDAETVAIQAIAFISADDVLLSRFVALTGCGLDILRDRVSDPEFLGAVLDFVLGDEACVVAFAEQSGLHPEAAGLARRMLP